ncbi:MAG: threonine synthase, partial [Gemmatimonadota bacterium]
EGCTQEESGAEEGCTQEEEGGSEEEVAARFIETKRSALPARGVSAVFRWDYTSRRSLVDSWMDTYVSTRGGATASLTEALARGLAPDGGLYVPTRTHPLEAPPGGTASSFEHTALWAAPALVPSVKQPMLSTVVSEALDFPVPLVEVGPNLHVLELFHGPTHAFKDIGARFMASLMAALLPRDRVRTVLVATSGDTGGAVAAAFHDMPGYRVVVLYPRNGISMRQRRQMTTLGGNVLALAVDGTFDDCQRLAKAAFLDAEMKAEFALTSANSINVGRLLPQALYYVHAAVLLGWEETRPRFAVPCGNLGNLCAGLLAQRCGMPSSGFLAATNVNSAFVDFLAKGTHEPRASIPTSSNAMDVGDPSNLERIQWLYRDDAEQLRRDVSASSVSDAVTARTIADVYEQAGYILDPHSAVAYHVATREVADASELEPTVVLATAHPAKFPEVVEAAVGHEIPLPPGLARAMQGEEHIIPVQPELRAIVEVLS